MKNGRLSTQKIVYTALFVALIAVCAIIQVPIGMVPISLATLAVILSGLILGPWLGLLATLCYLLLGLVGVPIFAGFKGGLSVIAGPTGGYLIGYLAISLFSGLFRRKNAVLAVAGIIIGNFLCYLLGTLRFLSVTDYALKSALAVCVWPFLPGDAMKIALSYLLFLKLQKPIVEHGLLSEEIGGVGKLDDNKSE